MNTRNICSVSFYLAFVITALLCVTQNSLADSAWKAGSAVVQITPQQYIWMAGYGHRSHPADGKYCDLRAKALVMEDARGRQAVLVSLDLVGIDRDLASELCDRLHRDFDLHREQIAICVTHTHTGPVVGCCLAPLHYLQVDQEQQKLIDAYTTYLLDRVVACVGQALDDLEPCQLSFGSGQATFAVNRRNNREPNVPELRIQGKLVGPVDHDVPVLAVRQADGKLKTVVFGYACHATVLSDYKWSGDYPGFAESELESAHPGVTAMFWAGCGADQNPLPRRKLELAQEYGRRLGQAVSRVLHGVMTPVAGQLRTEWQEVDLPLDTLPRKRELVADAESNNQFIHAWRELQMLRRSFGHAELSVTLPQPNRFVRARAEMLLQEIATGSRLSRTYPYPIGFWQLGDQVQFVFLGGEVVVDFALRLKRELQGDRTWVAGYANDVMAYIPSERVLQEGGYEGATAMIYYGLPTTWKPGVEAIIVDAVHAMTEPSFAIAP
jgi:neutral ceramidase